MTQRGATTFLAMEYYLLMWNRSFEISVTSSSVCGAFVQGAIAVNPPYVVPAETAQDPTRLVDSIRLAGARAEEPGSQAYLDLHRFNFAIDRAVLAGFRLDSRRKWGMGPLPHSGRLHLDVRGGKSRELILLGDQDGAALLGRIRAHGYPVAPA